jgi:hypothetical protein
MNSTNMYITLSILLKDVHKDVITLILRYFDKLDNICLILSICPNFNINKNIKCCLFQDAAFNGSLDIMKYMLANNFPYNSLVFMNAVNNGSLTNMKWLLANNFPYNSWVFNRAALNGSLTNMKWLLENNFPYSKKTVLSYAKDSVAIEWVDKNL